MIKIRLIGSIGDRFGGEWELAVKTASEVIRAIASQSQDFIEWITDQDKEGIGYEVLIDGNPITNDQLNIPIDKELVIIPVTICSGEALRIITGVALIASAFIFPAGLLGISSTALGLYGSALVLGGIFQLLGPKQSGNNGNQSSFGLDGSQLQQGYQGQCVPVLFGTYLLESPIPISVLTENENIPIDFVP